MSTSEILFPGESPDIERGSEWPQRKNDDSAISTLFGFRRHKRIKPACLRLDQHPTYDVQQASGQDNRLSRQM